MGKLSRRKGAAYELVVAKKLREVYPGAKRGLGQARSGGEVADVTGTPFWVQTKHGACPSLFAALAQAERDCAMFGVFQPVLVVARRNGGQDVAVLHLDALVDLLKDAEAGRQATRLTREPQEVSHAEKETSDGNDR